mmetsp:Transcript_3818/g.7870  ORF Transcript_3818/g.7870 Transcript_3818/m.7870 type:complete len:204 (+) Transcript_3818:466-1077(+)
MMEWREAREHLVNGAAQGPRVRTEVGELVLDDLLGHELRRPHVVLEDLVPRGVAGALDVRILQVLGGAEVNDLDHASAREHDVLALQVPVYDPRLSQVLAAVEDLREVMVRQVPRATYRLDVVPELATEALLHHNPYVQRVGEPCEHLDDVRVVRPLQAMLLHVEVIRLLQPARAVPVHDLHGVGLAVGHVDGGIDRNEGAAA